MDHFQTYITAFTSYVVALWAMTFSAITTTDSNLVAILGFLLLIARLVQELYKAWQLFVRKKDTDE